MDEPKIETREELADPEFAHVTLQSVQASQKDKTLKMGMTFTWAAKNIGWGQFDIIMDNTEGLCCWSEYCGKEFVMKALAHWASHMKVVQ